VILIPLYLLLFLFLLVFAVWFFFLAVMSLQRINDAGTIPRTAYILGQPILYVGLLIDFLGNVIVASILFLELPKEWLISARLNRLAAPATGWRSVIARWIGTNLLNPFDSRGQHIRF
jgi:hypothetical protein